MNKANVGIYGVGGICLFFVDICFVALDYKRRERATKQLGSRRAIPYSSLGFRLETGSDPES